MVGQEQFLNKLYSFTFSTLPHSILIFGDPGSGQEEVGNLLADRYNLLFYDISDILSEEIIDQIYVTSNPTLYAVNLNKLDSKDQTSLLKIYEEPNLFTYILFYGDSTYNVLETILNRSYILQMEKYTKDQLKKYITSDEIDLILDTCTTPGQITIANHTEMARLKDLCEKMVTKIGQANFFNTLSISDKINFKDEYNKYDFLIFSNMFCKVLLENNCMVFYKEFLKTLKMINFMNDKKSYFEHFLIKIWKLSRGLT